MSASRLSEPIIIAPDRRPASSLFAYRDLILLLVRVEYLTKIQQTALGPIWFVLQPLLMAGAFFGLFTKIIHSTSGGASPVLFYFSGLVIWGYFSAALSGVAASLATYAPLFRKTYFPRLALPLSVLIAKGIPFALQLMIFVVATVAHEGRAAWPAVVWLPVVTLAALLPAALAALGGGLLVAALSVRIRDLQHALGFLLQLGLYASPVVYATARVAEPYRAWFFLNPLAGAIEVFRHPFFGDPLRPREYAISLCVAVAWLLLGLARFKKIQGHFVDTL